MPRTAAWLAAGTAAVTAGYGLLVRPWMLRWGANEDEIARTLPGDELVENPKLVVNRAITIDAPPEHVWPWLVQLGQGRGGFYSYDRLENLFGLDIQTIDHIVPELQDLKVGDFVSLAKNGATGMVVRHLEPERALVLYAPDPRYVERLQDPQDADPFEMECTWAFYLQPLDDGVTRLTARFRLDHTSNPILALLLRSLLEPAHFIMERKMLQTIKELAERETVVEPGLTAEVA